MNVSGVSQTFFDRCGDAIEAEPGMAVDFSSVSSRFPGQFAPLDGRGILGYVADRGATQFYIHRSFALGDTLLGVPAARWVRERTGIEVEMRVSAGLASVVEALGVRATPILKRSPEALGIKMDGVLERDHTDDSLGRLHRSHIYLRAFGVSEEIGRLDWSAELERFPEPKGIDWPERFVVVAPRGSNACKTLDVGAVEYLIRLLRSKDISVFLVGDEMEIAKEEGVFPIWRSATVGELFYILSRAEAAVVTDSAALWISHFASTPIVAILGPSRAAERTALHPLAPEGVVVVDAAARAGCEPCTERGERCGKSWRCMRENGGWMADEAFEGVLRFIE